MVIFSTNAFKDSTQSPFHDKQMSDLAVPGFSQEIRRYGRFDVNGCLNCGSCTIVCDLSDGEATFPRRPIQYALIGLKEPLRESLEPWLCHDCGDCSLTCPRQAEPSESMRTLRRYLASQYDPTRITSRIYRSKAFELATLSFVGLLVLALVYYYHMYVVQLSASDFFSTPMGLEHMFTTITLFTRVVFLIPLFLIGLNAYRMYRISMRRHTIPARLYLTEAKTMVVEMVTHRRMSKCPEKKHKKRWKRHWLLGLSCAVISPILFFFLPWFQTDSIYPIYHPQRWLGYIVTAIMVYVTGEILIGRMKKRDPMYTFSQFGDLILPVLLLLTAISGIAVHIFRYVDMSLAGHFAYAIHLAIVVPMLLIEVPFGNWSHMVYRPLAIYLQRVKEKARLAEIPPRNDNQPQTPILEEVHAA